MHTLLYVDYTSIKVDLEKYKKEEDIYYFSLLSRNSMVISYVTAGSFPESVSLFVNWR